MAAMMQEHGSDDEDEYEDEVSEIFTEEETEMEQDTESETEGESELVIATKSKKKVQKQTVTKLYDLAFRAAQINLLWQKSQLPSLVVELAYKKENMAKLNRIFTDEQEDEYLKKMQSALGIIEDTLMKLNYLPFRLKVKLLAAIAGLNKDIKFVISEIAGNIDKCLKKDLKYCVTKIILTENGGVDLTKTILNIIKETQFKIEFRPLFLAHYCIKKSDVKTIYTEVLKEMNTAFALRKRKIKKNSKQEIYIENFKTFYNFLIDCDAYWERERFSSRFDLDARFQVISQIQYVTVRGHEDVLKFYFRKFKCSYQYAQEKQEVVMEMAKFAFLIGCFSVEKIMFFYRNLRSDLWNELLKKYFKEIFLSLLESWQYRDLCPKFFKEMIVYQDMENVKEIFTCVAALCYRERFEYYDIISVIQHVWFQTPIDVKEDKNICLVVIPRLILLKADFGSLIHFLRSYSVEIQKEILGQVVFGLLTSGRAELVQKCLKTAKQLDLHINDCKEVINLESFKQFLLIDSQFTEKSYSHLDSVTNLLCASKFEELKLKKDLFSETAFIVDLLSSISAKEDFDNILLWGLNERNVEMFKKKLLNEELINEVYDRRLIENDDLETADKVFKLLKYNSEEILMIKKRVHENPLVVRLLLTKLLNETDQLELTDEYLTWLFDNQEQRQLFMEEFIFSDDGKNAIFDALLTLENLETCPTLRFSGAKLMLKCWDLKEYWLKPFGLVAKMDEMLENNMQQFMSHRIVFKDRSNCDLNIHEEMLANSYARAIFTGFREIVKKNFSKLDIDVLEHLSLDYIGEYLERQDGSQCM